MSDYSSQQAAPAEGAASPRLRSEVDFAVDTMRTLREQLHRGDYRSEQDRLDVMVDLCDAFDELNEAMMLGADLPDVWRHGRVIRTVDELQVLPEGAVVRRGGFTPRVFERASDLWLEPGSDSPDYPGEHMLPALLLWHPDWEAS